MKKQNKNISYVLIKYMFENGVYNLDDLLDFVEMGNITIDEFENITFKSYNGNKKNGDT